MIIGIPEEMQQQLTGGTIKLSRGTAHFIRFCTGNYKMLLNSVVVLMVTGHEVIILHYKKYFLHYLLHFYFGNLEVFQNRNKTEI